MCQRVNLRTRYKDIPDDKFQEVVDYINFLKKTQVKQENILFSIGFEVNKKSASFR